MKMRMGRGCWGFKGKEKVNIISRRMGEGMNELGKYILVLAAFMAY